MPAMGRRGVALLGILCFLPALKNATAQPNAGPLLRVNRDGPHRSIGAAIRSAPRGATILVQAGTYAGSTALIDKDGLKLQAVGGRVTIHARGKSTEGKGIFVVRANDIRIEGFDFHDCAVPDRNGAGIRLDRGSLSIHDCGFFGNQSGVLTGNDADTILDVSNSEFSLNGFGDGQSHSLYAGRIAKLTVTSSYFHHGVGGQLIKSRAAESIIHYNRLTDELGGSSSYELEFPNGGYASVVGNIIQQSQTTENRTMVAYGIEGYAWPDNRLEMAFNTLIDERPANGIFLYVRPGRASAVAINNLLVGGSRRLAAANLIAAGNVSVDWDQLARPTREDYRLRAGSRAVGQAVPVASIPDPSMVPTREYQHPRQSRPLIQPPRHPGALQELAPV